MAAEPRAEMSTAGKAAAFFFSVFTAYATVGYIPILPAMAEHFKDTPNAALLVRGLLTVSGAAVAISSPIAGLLANRLGWRNMLIAGGLLYGVSGMVGAFVDDLYAILASRVFYGIGVAIIGTLLISIVTMEFEGERRNRWISYSTLVGTAASVVLLPLAGKLGAIDWRLPFMLNASVLILVALIAIGIREPRIQASEGAEPAAGALPWGPIVLGTLVGLVLGVQSLFVPFHLANIGIVDPTQISIAMAVGAGAGAVSAFFYARVRRKFSVTATFMLGLGCLAAGFALVGTAQSFTMAVAGGVIGGLGVGMVGPNVFAYAASVGIDRDRARNIGTARGAFLASPMLGQVLLEPVSHAAGPGAAILATAALALATVLSLRFISLERPVVAAT